MASFHDPPHGAAEASFAPDHLGVLAGPGGAARLTGRQARHLQPAPWVDSRDAAIVAIKDRQQAMANELSVSG